jgi:hypothetical protein
MTLRFDRKQAQEKLQSREAAAAAQSEPAQPSAKLVADDAAS